jgi:hypothetical protein
MESGKRKRGNERRPPASQEQEDHEHDEHDRFQQRALNRAHRVPDRNRTVHQHFDADRTGDGSAEFRQPPLNGVDDVDRVCVGLTINRKIDRTRIVVPAGDALVLDAIFDDRNVSQLDWRTVAPGDDQILILLRVGLLRAHVDGQVLLGAGDNPEWRVRSRLCNYLIYFSQRNAARGNRLRINANAQRVFLAAENVDLRDAADLRNLLADHRLGVLVDQRERQSVGQQREEQHGRVRRVHLAEARRHRHLGRQVSLCDRKRGLHIERGGIDVAIKIELDRDLGRAGRARRSHRGDAGDRRKLPLDGSRDGRRHDFRVRTRQVRIDVDGREIDARQRGYGEQAIAENAGHDDRHH